MKDSSRPPHFMPEAPTVPAQIAQTTRPKLPFPPDACDSHVHVFGPQWEYPHVADPPYIANDASVADLRRMLDALGCRRTVIVQPSYYGDDNRCTLDATRAGGGDFRAVVAVGPQATPAQLREMHDAGARGARMHLKGKDRHAAAADLLRLARQVAPLGWHVQIVMRADEMPQLDAELSSLPVEVVIDHIGYVDAADGLDGQGFRMLLRLARSGRAWFKLSAPYRQNGRPPLFEDVAPLARALYEAAPDRCVWGTDWPHVSRNDTGIIRVPNDGELADALIGWFPDAADRERILVTNPARLYGFPAN
ncbi:MAG TPA: amidohydrolase family protein [Ramlibacter sp.]|nr:amidohydrolase family protein [Ramlibacter sp.]